MALPGEVVLPEGALPEEVLGKWEVAPEEVVLPAEVVLINWELAPGEAAHSEVALPGVVLPEEAHSEVALPAAEEEVHT